MYVYIPAVVYIYIIYLTYRHVPPPPSYIIIYVGIALLHCRREIIPRRSTARTNYSPPCRLCLLKTIRLMAISDDDDDDVSSKRDDSSRDVDKERWRDGFIQYDLVTRLSCGGEFNHHRIAIIIEWLTLQYHL